MVEYILKCTACGLEIPVEPIVAMLMRNNTSDQSFCSSCGASDSVKLMTDEQLDKYRREQNVDDIIDMVVKLDDDTIDQILEVSNDKEPLKILDEDDAIDEIVRIAKEHGEKVIEKDDPDE